MRSSWDLLWKRWIIYIFFSWKSSLITFLRITKYLELDKFSGLHILCIHIWMHLVRNVLIGRTWSLVQDTEKIYEFLKTFQGISIFFISSSCPRYSDKKCPFPLPCGPSGSNVWQNPSENVLRSYKLFDQCFSLKIWLFLSSGLNLWPNSEDYIKLSWRLYHYLYKYAYKFRSWDQVRMQFHFQKSSFYNRNNLKWNPKGTH